MDGTGPATVFGQCTIRDASRVFGRWYSVACPDGIDEWRDGGRVQVIPPVVFDLAAVFGWDIHAA